MLQNKFRVGQMVVFGTEHAGRGEPARRVYKVLRTLLQPGGDCLYRIKSIAEASDRIVIESELQSHAVKFWG